MIVCKGRHRRRWHQRHRPLPAVIGQNRCRQNRRLRLRPKKWPMGRFLRLLLVLLLVARGGGGGVVVVVVVMLMVRIDRSKGSVATAYILFIYYLKFIFYFYIKFKIYRLSSKNCIFDQFLFFWNLVIISYLWPVTNDD
jgi:hypothetical protein